MDVILHLTHDCQLDCVYCYGGRKAKRPMSWEVACRAIDMLFEQPATDPPPLLSFFGGEPLLEFALIRQCIAYTEGKKGETGRGFRLSITTNGLGASEVVADYLMSKEVDVTLSFDGVPEAQNGCRPYRDGRGSFAGTSEAMLRLLPRFPGMAVCAVVSPENAEHLPASIDFFLDAGIRRIWLNPNFFAPWGEREIDLWRRGYEHMARRCYEEFLAGRVVHVNFLMAKIVTHLKGQYDPCDCCDFGRKEIAVAPSGNIYPCQRMVGDDHSRLGQMGSVFDGWNATACTELEAARQITSLECLQCDLRPRCRNWCSCVNQRLTGRFDRVGPLVCFHERMAIEIADRMASRLFQEQNKTFLETFYHERHVVPEWV